MKKTHLIPAFGLLGLLSIGLLLGGCEGGGSTVREAAAADRYVNLAGGTVTLHQALPVKAGEARVFLQHGEVAGKAGFYAPQCNFEIDSVQHGDVSIKPDVFKILRVQHVMEEVVQAHLPLKVASLTLAGMDDAGIAQYFEGYHFWLESPKQPQVRRMSCYGVHAEPGVLQPPTLKEIRETLGNIASIGK
jgi:hypothetical protein